MTFRRNELVQAVKTFSGFSSEFDDARYVVVGFPFDSTSTYRFGSRKAPKAIREASLNIETYSFRTGLYVEDLKLCDLGDVKISENFDKTFSALGSVAKKVLSTGKKLISLGGEHTLTYIVSDALPKGSSIISFDAHFDLRDEYGGRKLSHATFMRRITEKVGPEKLVMLGVRAACREELEYAALNNIKYLTSTQVRDRGPERVSRDLKRFVRGSPTYLSIDMDVLDPSYAPAVANPEPDGLDINVLLTVMQGVCDEELVGFDLVECTPEYDFGVTSLQAAKIIFEAMCFTEKKLRSPGKL